MVGIVDTYMIPFAMALKAAAPQIGILASLPNLVSALLQSQAEEITGLFGGRKRTILGLTAFQIAALILMGLIPMLPIDIRIAGLIMLAVFYTSSNSLLLPVWGSLISVYLPMKKRSGYFGWRSRVLGLVLIGGGLVGGIILSLGGKYSLSGFIIIFLLAGLLRVGSFRQGRRVFEPRHHLHLKGIGRPGIFYQSKEGGHFGKFLTYSFFMMIHGTNRSMI